VREKSLLYLDRPGVGLLVRENRLIVKTSKEEMVFVPQSHRFQCIILVVRGFVTTDALRWLSAEHVAVLVVHEGEFLTVVSAAA
jgi:CRISPR/Cas system-associated endonuclease Cas1